MVDSSIKVVIGLLSQAVVVMLTSSRQLSRGRSTVYTRKKEGQKQASLSFKTKLQSKGEEMECGGLG
ncbi:hypothetical protein CCACVL1_15294 [Corchorus capsularis]|uniref:Uncharacterized protein n=1 Tax=Corchorus capsularis TaxID=210143 RepID=A0A1R3I2V8_COCAP|nr:hypothetical protein CCACVL1_15294 [Corchorus capsularis]